MTNYHIDALDLWAERIVQKNMKSFAVSVNVAADERTDVMTEVCYQKIKQAYEAIHDKFLLACNGKVKLVVMRNEENFDIGKFLDKSRAIRDMFERRLLLPIDRFVIQHKKGDKAEFLFEIDFYEEN